MNSASRTGILTTTEKHKGHKFGAHCAHFHEVTEQSMQAKTLPFLYLFFTDFVLCSWSGLKNCTMLVRFFSSS